MRSSETSEAEFIAQSQSTSYTPGKVAIWLFLATEVMFFTGLIGSYIVLRLGSPPTTYSTLYAPGRVPAPLPVDRVAFWFPQPINDPLPIVRLLSRIARSETTRDMANLEKELRSGQVLTPAIPRSASVELLAQLHQLDPQVEVVAFRAHSWPRPYDRFLNPLNVDITLFSTLVLIGSSATMALALSAFARGRSRRGSLLLLGTLCAGLVFLGIQLHEYHALLWGDLFPIGVCSTQHFTPDSSVFASCYFTLTGFHAIHVLMGLVVVGWLWVRTLGNNLLRFNRETFENIGIYWHFVGAVWILLFLIVYLV